MLEVCSSRVLEPVSRVLEPGIVIAAEPMVNLGTKRVIAEPDHWTMSTADGKPSAHFEHTLAITEEGVRILTEPPNNPEELETLLPGNKN